MLSVLVKLIRRRRRDSHRKRLLKLGLRIGRNTHFMDDVFIDSAHAFLVTVGDNCTIAPKVRILAHDASMRKHLGCTRLGKVSIGDNCFVGDSAIILPGVTIGPNAVIGAGSVVTRDVPPDSVAAGNPARVLGSFQEFMEKHRQALGQSRGFPYQLYDVRFISEERKEEMKAFLEEHPGAYMVG